MSDAIPIHSPSPSPFSRNDELLPIREFELFRESQSKLEGERQLRMNEAALAAERYVQVQIQHLEAKTEARFVSSDKALALASLETSQHLRDLNGEQGRILADRDRSVSKDTHEAQKKDFDVWRDGVNKYMSGGISKDTYEAQQKDLAVWRDQVNKFMSMGQGRDKGIGISWSVVLSLAAFLFGLAGFAGFIIGLIRN